MEEKKQENSLAWDALRQAKCKVEYYRHQARMLALALTVSVLVNIFFIWMYMQ